VFFIPKKGFSKKKVYTGFGVSQAFSKKKVFSGLEAFFCPKMAQDTSLRGSKSRRGAKMSPGGAAAPLPPYFPRLCFLGIFGLKFLH